MKLKIDWEWVMVIVLQTTIFLMGLAIGFALGFIFGIDGWSNLKPRVQGT